MLPGEPFVEVEGRFLASSPTVTIKFKASPLEIRHGAPVTLLRPCATADGTIARLDSFFRRDDVICTMFLETVVFISPDDSPLTDNELLDKLAGKWPIKKFAWLSLADDDCEGPFFVGQGGLHAALRLYPDDLDCFYVSVIESNKDGPSFSLFPHTITGGLHATIPVPSRLHSQPSASRPLAGLRLAVKDIYDLKGVHTTGGCRAYQELYPPRDKTAPALQRLIDLGAVVVGKTRTGQFAFGTAPKDSLDYLSNLNPRGDGRQSQSGSSGGSAGAVAAYDWIDFAIGTDTTGSTRGPANVYGLFAMRPSHGMLPMENILPQSPTVLDTPGVLCRDISTLCLVMESWLQGVSGGNALIQPPGHDAARSHTSLGFTGPDKLLLPTRWLPWKKDKQYPQVKDFIDRFTSDVQSFFDLEGHEVDLDELFRETKIGGEGEDIPSYLFYALPNCMLFDHYNFYRPFRTEYKQRYGKPPYVERGVDIEWQEGKKVSKATREDAGRRIMAFRSWFAQHVMIGDESRGTESLIVFPTGRSFGPSYRDAQPGEIDFDDYETRHDCLSVYGGLPEIVIPVGQYPYFSKVTQQVEMLPMCISILGARKSDVALLRLTRWFLENSPWETSVATGPEAFPRKRAQD